MAFATRKYSEVFLIRNSSSSVPKSQLPTHGDVLRCIAWERQKAGNLKTPLNSLVSCPVIRGTKLISCALSGGCREKDNKEDLCIVSKVKIPWNEAGIKTLQDFTIRKKICDLSDEFTYKIKKKEKLITAGAVSER